VKAETHHTTKVYGRGVPQSNAKGEDMRLLCTLVGALLFYAWMFSFLWYANSKEKK